MSVLPNFRSDAFLREHALAGLAFYDQRCLDASGGFFEAFADDGRVVDGTLRHVAGTARFVMAHAQAALQFPDHAHAMAWRAAVRHGLDFLRTAHRQADGSYGARIKWHGAAAAARNRADDAAAPEAVDLCEAHAWVVLAQAHGLMAGIVEVEGDLHQSFDHMGRRFWEAGHGLYAHGADAQGRLVESRTQRTNLRACEAALAAFDATDDVGYLERAVALAESVTQGLAGAAQQGRLWESHRADWSIDPQAPHGGFVPGHWLQWSRLLLVLERELPGLDDDNWLVHRARELFALAANHAWDRHHGGLVLSLDPHDKPLDARRLAWVQAEGIAAAAELAQRTHEGSYWGWYDRLWEFAWRHLAAARHGRWLVGLDATQRALDRDADSMSELQHLAACHTVLAALER